MEQEQTKNGAQDSRDADVREHKDLAAFSYVWVMAFVVFLAKRDSAFARFHSKQAIVLCFLTALWLVPVVGHFLTLFVVAGMLYGFINASQGQWTDVPVAGPLSRGELSLTEMWENLKKLWNSIWKKKEATPTPPSPASPPSSTAPTPSASNVDNQTGPQVP